MQRNRIAIAVIDEIARVLARLHGEAPAATVVYLEPPGRAPVWRVVFALTLARVILRASGAEFAGVVEKLARQCCIPFQWSPWCEVATEDDARAVDASVGLARAYAARFAVPVMARARRVPPSEEDPGTWALAFCPERAPEVSSPPTVGLPGAVGLVCRAAGLELPAWAADGGRP